MVCIYSHSGYEKVNEMKVMKKTIKMPSTPKKVDLRSSNSLISKEYVTVLREIQKRIQTERLRIVMTANSAMILLYWDIGQIILERQKSEGWGAKVIDRLSLDLREAFPEMQGLSSRNLKYMRSFASAWPRRQIVQEVLAQITWYHNIALLEKIANSQTRLWYAKAARTNGWSRNILALQIQNHTHERQGMTINNFPLTLPSLDSDMATQIFKDPYLFDFLGTADLSREREVEKALIDHVQKFLIELRTGFAFVGRQVHLKLSSEDYYLDLLFYHLKLRRYIVVELKVVPFDPAFVGTLNTYLSAVDDLLRHKEDKPTIGLLLCHSKNKMVVEYALRSFQKPMGVATWKAQLVRSLPAEFKGSLPSISELEKELMKE